MTPAVAYATALDTIAAALLKLTPGAVEWAAAPPCVREGLLRQARVALDATLALDSRILQGLGLGSVDEYREAIADYLSLTSAADLHETNCVKDHRKRLAEAEERLHELAGGRA